jgi:CheY-like chemotaxis protein
MQSKIGSDAHPFSNISVIVVEDNDDVRTQVSSFLAEMGAKVAVAKNGREGLDAIRNCLPSLVVSDIKMPEMDGFQMLREIRTLGSEAGGRVPVIAMTAFVMQRERTDILDAGFEAYLAKPFTPNKLIETILAVLRLKCSKR